MNNITLAKERLQDALKLHITELEKRALSIEAISPDLPAATESLRGIIEGLNISGTINTATYKTLCDLLQSGESNATTRPGREHTFYVLVKTEKGKEYDFNVAAVNPSDAYFQLTRRSSYKAIADIMGVEVFNGPGLRSDAPPLKSFQRDELVFNSLTN